MRQNRTENKTLDRWLLGLLFLAFFTTALCACPISKAEGRTMEPRENRITVRSASLKPYLMSVLLQIEQQGWTSAEPGRYPGIAFRITSDGSIQLLRMHQSSGRALIDNSALKLIKETKFKPLPSDFNAGIDVLVTFSASGPYIRQT